MSAYRRFGLLVVVMVFLSAACTHLEAPDEIFHRQDTERDWGKRPPDAGDRARHEVSGKRPFEWWYFDGHLDSGHTFVGVFHMPSFVSGKPAVTFSLYSPDWGREDYVAEFEPEEKVSASTEDLSVETPAGFVRRIDENSFHAVWSLDGIRADLTFTTMAPGWSPRENGGDVNTERMDFFWVIHQARNRIEGTITRDGKTMSVTGVGYADHNWGRKALPEITRRWVWGRIIAGPYTIVYADVDYYDPKVVSRPLYIAKGDRIILGTGSPAIRQSDFETEPGLGRFFPRQVAISYQSEGVSTDIRITKKRLVESVDLLTAGGYQGSAHWFIRTFVARPAYFRIIAEFEGYVETGGQREPVSGECLYEVMNFE